MKTKIKNILMMFVCVLLTTPTAFAEREEGPYAAKDDRPTLLDWIQGRSAFTDRGDDDSEVTTSQKEDGNDSPSPGNTSSKYTFNSGKKLAGGDRGGMFKSCGVIQLGKPCAATKMSEKFAPFLMETMGKCVDEGLKAQGLGSGHSKVIVKHMGTYSNRTMRRGRKLSMHATGRSMDLSGLEITTSSGKLFKINMTIASVNKPFYKTFGKCWQAANRSRCGGKGIGRMAGCLDAHFNSDHHNHMHLSMPYCPAKPGIAGT